jgi:hypothetical protein
MSRPTHEPSHPALRPHVANLWLGSFNPKHPLYADDCYLACQGSEVSWERMFCFGVVKTDCWRKVTPDWFGSGYEGPDPHEQIVNGALAWGDVKDVEELKGTDENTLQRFDIVWERWCRFRDAWLKAQEDKPLPEPPKPEPKPPEPVKPEPKPPEPVKPPEAPKPRTDWKRSLKWLGTLATIASGSFFLWGLALPPGVREFVKAVLAAISGAF